MVIPKIYYNETKDEWVVVHNETESGAICFGDCKKGNCAGPLPCNNTGIFGGGEKSSYLRSIEYIIISTPGNAHLFGNLYEERTALAATSNGTNDRGVFGGGKNDSLLNLLDKIIDYITISTPGGAKFFGELEHARQFLAATSNGTNDRGVFGGGIYKTSGFMYNFRTIIDYITISTLGSARVFGNLSVIRDALGATSNGTNDRGVFGGGHNISNADVSIIDYITISTPGNATNFGNLSRARQLLAATSNGTNNRGVFSGGKQGHTILFTIDYITISTPSNATKFGNLSVARRSLAATSNGINDTGIFGGGEQSNTILSTIDYITISTPSNATNFGNLSVERENLAATSNA